MNIEIKDREMRSRKEPKRFNNTKLNNGNNSDCGM
jgi:hypothetical protein